MADPSSYSGLSDDQLQAILGMQNLTAQEQAIQQQAAIGNALRQGGPGGRPRSGTAANLGRLISGASQAYGQYQAGQARQKFLQDLAAKMQANKAAGAAPAGGGTAGTAPTGLPAGSEFMADDQAGLGVGADLPVTAGMGTPDASTLAQLDPETLKNLGLGDSGAGQ